jgi:uncharacterized protein (DUF952 family)
MTFDRDDASQERPKQPAVTLHLTPLGVWESQRDAAAYRPEPFEREGFIHCTDGEERMLEVGNRYYAADPRPFCVLEIDRTALIAPVIYEDPEQVYPHIYGPLNTEAVRSVRHVERDGGGRFVRFGTLLAAP